MQCLENLVGLRGACADITSTAFVFTDPHVTKRELADLIDQQDYPQGVDYFFQDLRRQAALEVVAGVNAAFAERYLARTVIQTTGIGDYGDTLTATTGAALLKGVRLFRPYELPNVAYRITRVGFMGQYTGMVTVQFIDGITGQVLGTVDVDAVDGVPTYVEVNDLYRVRVLHVCYDATGIDAYKTTTGYESTCFTCPDHWAVNGVFSAMAFTAPLATPLVRTTVTDMGGLLIDVSMECDSESWLCSIKQQLAMPMLWKVCELAMGYGANVSGRSNTATVRDAEKLAARQMMFNERYQAAFEAALKQAQVPNDPQCFVCKRSSRIAVSIP